MKSKSWLKERKRNEKKTQEGKKNANKEKQEEEKRGENFMFSWNIQMIAAIQDSITYTHTDPLLNLKVDSMRTKIKKSYHRMQKYNSMSQEIKEETGKIRIMQRKKNETKEKIKK